MLAKPRMTNFIAELEWQTLQTISLSGEKSCQSCRLPNDLDSGGWCSEKCRVQFATQSLLVQATRLLQVEGQVAEEEGLEEVGKLEVSQLKVWKNVVTNLTSNKTSKPKLVNPKKVNTVDEQKTNGGHIGKSIVNHYASNIETSFNQFDENVNEEQALKVKDLDMTLKVLDGNEANKAVQAVVGSETLSTAKKLMNANTKRRSRAGARRPRCLQCSGLSLVTTIPGLGDLCSFCLQEQKYAASRAEVKAGSPGLARTKVKERSRRDVRKPDVRRLIVSSRMSSIARSQSKSSAGRMKMKPRHDVDIKKTIQPGPGQPASQPGQPRITMKWLRDQLRSRKKPVSGSRAALLTRLGALETTDWLRDQVEGMGEGGRIRTELLDKFARL